jgi:uncharacterized protein (TIGR01777 family)
MTAFPPALYALLGLQALLGAFDNLWHHEWQARLPHRPSARRELALHAAREALYGVLFAVVALLRCQGAWAVLLAVLLAAELLITLADFLEEDRTRRLPPFERLLHTVLTALYGAFVATFTPVLVDWAVMPTALVVEPRGALSAVFGLCSLGVFAWSVRNVMALRAHPRVDVAGAGTAPTPDRGAVLVTGGTGFVGSALVAALRRDGWRVIVLSRDPLAARGLWDSEVRVVGRLDDLPDETRIDAAVHLAGARVLGLPWTAARRLTLQNSRLGITREVLALIGRLRTPPQVLVAASAVGFYGVPPQGMADEPPCDEQAPSVPGQFASQLCATIEREAMRAQALGVRVVCPRFGLVLGRDGGAFPMQALAARLGFGAVVGSGRQPMPWVHLDDATALIRFAIDTPSLQGPVNVVAPELNTQAGFARELAAAVGRRVRLRVPGGPLRLAGGEMMSLILDGRAVMPTQALRHGFRFRHPTLAGACADLTAPART